MSADAVSLADIYSSILASVGASSRSTRVSIPKVLDSQDIERQCREIDELWCELGNCIHHWRGHPAEFIATRFANMHYVDRKGVSAGSAYPPDDVWTYLVNKIEAQIRSRVVIIRHATYTRGEIRSWK